MVPLRTAVVLLASLCAATAVAQEDDLSVELVTALREPLVMDMQLSGTLAALDSLDLGFRQSGRVVEVLVEEGDHVAAGQTLARLDSVQQDQALKVAQSSLAAAQAAQSQARQASDRAKALLERGVGTRAARDAAVQASSQADGSVQRAESMVDQAQRALDETVLYAPSPAVITRRDVAPGQIVGAAQPILSLAALGGLEAVFQAPDDPLLDEAMGQSVRLATIDIDRPDMTATVTEIAPLVDPQTGTVTVRARVDGADPGDGLLGAAVRGHLEVSSDTGVSVPWTALMRQGEDAAVWVVADDGTVSLTPVRIDLFAQDKVYLAEGVQPGQIVVGAGSQMLYPGRRVLTEGTRP